MGSGSFMQSKHLCVLIHFMVVVEASTFRHVESSWCFFADRSRAVLL